MKEFLEKAAKSYVDYLNNDNGVYTTSHLYLIRIMQYIPKKFQKEFHAIVHKLLTNNK